MRVSNFTFSTSYFILIFIISILLCNSYENTDISNSHYSVFPLVYVKIFNDIETEVQICWLSEKRNALNRIDDFRDVPCNFLSELQVFEMETHVGDTFEIIHSQMKQSLGELIIVGGQHEYSLSIHFRMLDSLKTISPGSIAYIRSPGVKLL